MKTINQFPKPPHRSWIIAATLRCLIALVILTILLQLVFRFPGQLDFLLRRNQYEAIVNQIKRSHSEGSSEASIRMFGDTAIAIAMPARQNGYVIEIITADLDHAGVHGYIFADGPAPHGNPYFGVADDGRDLPYTRDRLNAHWWCMDDSPD